MQPLTPRVNIEHKIYSVRGLNVMIDHDLAVLYQVPTKALIQAVKRNRDRFPTDFMFQLTDLEAAKMRSQTVTASKRNIRFRPFAFTEQGVAMLSSVLRSTRAVLVNVEIMRAFVKIRALLSTQADFQRQLQILQSVLRRHDRKLNTHDNTINKVLLAIHSLLGTRKSRSRPIGFRAS